MITVTYNDISIECSKALKGSNYIHLLNSSGLIIAAFENVKDFSAFAISGGEWTTPTSADSCYIAVLGEDGTIQKSNKKACDVAIASDVGALSALGTTDKSSVVGAVNETLSKVSECENALAALIKSYSENAVMSTSGALGSNGYWTYTMLSSNQIQINNGSKMPMPYYSAMVQIWVGKSANTPDFYLCSTVRWSNYEDIFIITTPFTFSAGNTLQFLINVLYIE